MKTRIFVCELLQESNSFNPVLAGFDDFYTAGIFEGDALIRAEGKAGATMHGIVQGINDYKCLAIGGVRMRAKSGGPVDHSVVDWFVEKTIAEIKKSGPFDGVIVSMHGATVSDVSEDVCGDVLEIIRKQIGENAILSVTCDLHANITKKMVVHADYICGYQTYPHLDHYEVGYRAAKLTCERILGKRSYMAKVSIPLMAPAHGYSTENGSLKKLMERGHELVKANEILDFSVFQVQPWLDVAEIASTVLVDAENEETAKTAAVVLAMEEFFLREELQGEELWKIEDVIELALKNNTDCPVILVDSADSPNAGATGDSAAVLESLLKYRDSLKAAVCVNDVAVVEQAFSSGIGAVCDFKIGASLAPDLSLPVILENAIVKSLHDGDFWLGGPAERGQKRSIGKTAVLQAGEILIHVSSRGQNNGDLQFYRSFGIEPSLCKLVCVKACSSFRAGYEPVSTEICNTFTPGAACPVLKNLPYKRLPNPFYPFQEIDESMVTEPEIYR